MLLFSVFYTQSAVRYIRLGPWLSPRSLGSGNRSSVSVHSVLSFLSQLCHVYHGLFNQSLCSDIQVVSSTCITNNAVANRPCACAFSYHWRGVFQINSCKWDCSAEGYRSDLKFSLKMYLSKKKCRELNQMINNKQFRQHRDTAEMVKQAHD